MSSKPSLNTDNSLNDLLNDSKYKKTIEALDTMVKQKVRGPKAENRLGVQIILELMADLVLPGSGAVGRGTLNGARKIKEKLAKWFNKNNKKSTMKKPEQLTKDEPDVDILSLIHISEPTRLV